MTEERVKPSGTPVTDEAKKGKDKEDLGEHFPNQEKVSDSKFKSPEKEGGEEVHKKHEGIHKDE